MALFLKAPPTPALDATDLIPAPYNTPRTFTAAAQRVNTSNPQETALLRRRLRSSSAAVWQNEALLLYDAIGEIKFAFTLLANVASRARLYPAAITSPDSPPAALSAVPDLTPGLAAAATYAYARLTSSPDASASALIRAIALNMCVTGECWLVQTPLTLPNPTDNQISAPERWRILSVSELTASQQDSSQLAIRPSLDSTPNEYVPIPRNSFVGRMWRPHPRHAQDPDSSMLGVLDSCNELLLLNRTFRATARSRLNAGALYLPDGLSAAADTPPAPVACPPGSNQSADPSQNPIPDPDPFEQELVDAISTPISDPESAAAVVPLIIRGPAELAESIKQFKFERSFDPALATRADRVLDRILQGLDLPKELVSGISNVRYSNATVIADTLYQAHVEPLLLLACDSLTQVYLRPALQAAGFTAQQAARITLWYDPSPIITRPNRATDADAGYDRYLVSASSWRSAHGFSDSDAPLPEETAFRLLVEKGQIPPELTELLLQSFAPSLMSAVRVQQQATSQSPLPPEVRQALGEPPSMAPVPSHTPGLGPPV